MRFSGKYATLFSAVVLLTAAAASAAQVDMKDPRRALGREDDVRVDAQLVRDTVSSNSPIAITYQIQNLSQGWIAVADKICTSDYDSDSQTITVSVGAEVPTNGAMPHMTMIGPGEKKTLTAGASAHVVMPASRSPFSAFPRYVQVKVSFLRDLTQFKEMIAKQMPAPQPPVKLSDAQFDAWIESNDSVVLNAIPVQWTAAPGGGAASAERRQPGTFDTGGGGTF